MLKSTIAAAGLLLAVMAPQGANALVYNEAPGDAGRLLSTAEIITGNEIITQIRGRLGRDNGVDMYGIYIPDPGDFRATVRDNGNTTVTDTQLFLFDSDGFGIVANDDFNNPNIQSRIRPFAGDPGLYFLAITAYNTDPRSDGGRIFPNQPFTAQLGPTGPGGGETLTSWRQRSADSGDIGNYRINLRGATTVSEPATLAMLGAAFAGFAGMRRRKS